MFKRKELEMKVGYKQEQFSVELAKEIQQGKVEGFVECANGEPARIVEFNMKGNTDIVVVRENVEVRIEWCYPYKCNGKTIREDDPEHDLVLYVKEKKEKELKPFDKVLVRNKEGETWVGAIFSHMDYSLVRPVYICTGFSVWQSCIPFEGNEDLLGTTKSLK